MRIPEVKDSSNEWLLWCNMEFPFDERAERWLMRRQPEDRAPGGTIQELHDLCGIADRSLAAMLAAIWANTNKSLAHQIRIRGWDRPGAFPYAGRDSRERRIELAKYYGNPINVVEDDPLVNIPPMNHALSTPDRRLPPEREYVPLFGDEP